MASNPSNAPAAESVLAQSALVNRKPRLTDRALFFKKFLAKGRQISSAVPSSKALVAGLLRHVDFSKPGAIVELGAGTGPVTEEIVERLQPFHRFVAVENDVDFCDVLRRRFPETTLLQMDATRISDSLASLSIQKVDYVISGLPTPNLPPRAMIRMWQWLRRSLAPNGLFLQITVAPLVYRGFYDRLFDEVRYEMIWRNVPPGGVYKCSRPRNHLFVTKS